MLDQEIMESMDSPFIDKPIYLKVSAGLVYASQITFGGKVSFGLMRKVLSTGVDIFAHKTSPDFIRDELKDPKQEMQSAFRLGACLFLGGVYNTSQTLSFGGHIKVGYAFIGFSEKYALASVSKSPQGEPTKDRTTADISGGMCFGGDAFIKVFLIQGIAVDCSLLGMYYLGEAKGFMFGAFPGLSLHFDASFIQDVIFKTAVKTAVKASVGTIVKQKTSDWLNS